MNQAMQALAHDVTLGTIGVPCDQAAPRRVESIQAQMLGATITGIVEGDSVPDEYIPHLLKLHRAGRFPFDKLITTMPFGRINEAVAAQHRGDAVKIVLVHD